MSDIGGGYCVFVEVIKFIFEFEYGDEYKVCLVIVLFLFILFYFCVCRCVKFDRFLLVVIEC